MLIRVKIYYFFVESTLVQQGAYRSKVRAMMMSFGTHCYIPIKFDPV